MEQPTLGNSHLERLIDIGRSLTSNLDLESLLTQIAEAARELTGARYAAVGVLNESRDELERFVAVGIGTEQRALIGDLPRGRGVLGVLIEDPVPLRLAHVSDHSSSFGFPENHPPMQSFLGVPLLIAGEAYGNLYLTDKRDGEFDDDDEAAVVTLATWAAIAIQNARSVREDRLRATISAAEQERQRWARELHDETLQSLGALLLLLASALRRGDSESLKHAATGAVEQLQVEIANLRSLITELRPAALDEIGLVAALESLASRTAAVADIKVELDMELDPSDRQTSELEVTIYRLVQESITNAIKHAGSSHVWIRAETNPKNIEVSIRDDGAGFDPETATAGFGLLGMKERVSLAGGEFEILSAPDSGTTVRATLPRAPGAHLDPTSTNPLSSA